MKYKNTVIDKITKIPKRSVNLTFMGFFENLTKTPKKIVNKFLMRKFGL
jgi:hypothetical protein